MVCGIPAVFVFIPLKQREVNDPAESQFVVITQAESVTHQDTQAGKGIINSSQFIRNEQQQVAVFRIHAFQQLFPLVVCNKFAEGAGGFTLCVDLDISQPVGAPELDLFCQFVQLFAGIFTGTLGVNAADRTAIIDSIFKHGKTAVGSPVADIDQFHAKAHVRGIFPEAVHGFLIGELRPGVEHDLLLRSDLFNHLVEHLFHQVEDVITFAEGHFHIQLSEFRLTVATGVFITEAAGNLEVFFHTGHLEQLFELLRTLRQCPHFTRINAGRDDIVTGAFRCRFEKDRGFDFQKAAVIEIVPHKFDQFVTQDQIIAHLFTAQIQKAVFQT